MRLAQSMEAVCPEKIQSPQVLGSPAIRKPQAEVTRQNEAKREEEEKGVERGAHSRPRTELGRIVAVTVNAL